MKTICIATTLAAITFASTAFAQASNQSGISQPSVTGGQYGQTRDGTHWESHDVNGTQVYSDDRGRNCWSQTSSGSTFTSCNR